VLNIRNTVYIARGVAIRYVLPVLWMTSNFLTMGPVEADEERDQLGRLVMK